MSRLNYVDPKRCKQDVGDSSGWHHHQCTRKPVKDGFCTQHHPETEKARRDDADRRYKEKIAEGARIAIVRAVHLLRANGYTVTPPSAGGES